MIIGYIRVSTIEQDAENQKKSLLEFANTKKLIVDEFIKIKISSRKSTKERKIDQLLDSLNEGDVIIATELSRLGRSVSEVLGIVNQIVKKKAELITIKDNIQIQNNDSIQSKIMITMVSLFSELERDLISKRTKEALLIKKAEGVKLGRPKGPGKSKLDEQREFIQSCLDKNMSKLSIAKYLGVSYTTLFNFVRQNKLLNGKEKAVLIASQPKVMKMKLHLAIENNSKFTRGKKKSVEWIKNYILPTVDPGVRNIGNNIFIIRMRYKELEDLNKQVYDLLNEISVSADLKNCNAEDTWINSMEAENLSWG